MVVQGKSICDSKTSLCVARDPKIQLIFEDRQGKRSFSVSKDSFTFLMGMMIYLYVCVACMC